MKRITDLPEIPLSIEGSAYLFARKQPDGRWLVFGCIAADLVTTEAPEVGDALVGLCLGTVIAYDASQIGRGKSVSAILATGRNAPK